jgi:predicted Na+-dependent transporter
LACRGAWAPEGLGLELAGKPMPTRNSPRAAPRREAAAPAGPEKRRLATPAEKGLLVRKLAALVFGALPVLLIVSIRDASGIVSLPEVIAPAETHFAQAVERLTSVSETLGTISLAMIAAAAFLASRQRSRRAWFALSLAYLIFVFNLLSLYFAVRLGYFSALSLAVDSRDIIMLVSFLDYQALTVLVAAGLLVSLALGGDLKDEK